MDENSAITLLEPFKPYKGWKPQAARLRTPITKIVCLNNNINNPVWYDNDLFRRLSADYTGNIG